VDPETGRWSVNVPATEVVDGTPVEVVGTVRDPSSDELSEPSLPAEGVIEVNFSPVAVDDTASVVEAGVETGGNDPQPGAPVVQGNVLANDSDADGDPLLVTSVAAGTERV